MVGFHEVFTKRSYNNWEIWNNYTDKSLSQDPWICHNISTSVLFEGNYITAFGLVTLNQVTGKFRMMKPLAFVSGGIKNLINFLKSRASAFKWKSI